MAFFDFSLSGSITTPTVLVYPATPDAAFAASLVAAWVELSSDGSVTSSIVLGEPPVLEEGTTVICVYSVADKDVFRKFAGCASPVVFAPAQDFMSQSLAALKLFFTDWEVLRELERTVLPEDHPLRVKRDAYREQANPQDDPQ